MQIKHYSEFPFDLIEQNKVPVFCSFEYGKYLSEVKSESVSWFIGLINNEAACVIPFSIKRKFFFRKGYFLTAVINLDTINEFEEKDFLDLAVEYIEKNNFCDWIEQPPNWAIFRTVPSNSVYCEFGSYIIDLREKNESDLYGDLQKKQRQSVSRALRDGIVVKKGIEYLDDCMAVLKDISKREGVKYPRKEEVQKLMDILKDKVQVYTAFYNNEPHAAGILLTNEFSTYSIYGGAISKAAQGSDPLLCWESIKDANANCVKFFDFVGARINPAEGSKYERIQRFKERFGATMIRGYLWKMPLSPIKYTLYKSMVHTYFLLKSKVYKGDIIDQELNSYNININPLKQVLQVLSRKRTRAVNVILCTFDSVLNPHELVLLSQETFLPYLMTI